MAFFIAPFAGLAVGGGGHYSGDYNQSPPPSGTGDNASPARSRLRVLGQDGKRMKKKFVKIVPPGQFPALAPPYEWRPHERADWKYPQKGTNGVYPKKQKIEARFFSSRSLLVELKFPPTADPVKRAITDKINQARVVTNQIQELTQKAREAMERHRQKHAAGLKQAQVVRHGQFETAHWVRGPLTRNALRLIEVVDREYDDDAPHGLTNPDGSPAEAPVRSPNYQHISVGMPQGRVSEPRPEGSAPFGLSRQPPGSPELASALSSADADKKIADDIHEKQIPPLRTKLRLLRVDINRLKAQKATAKPAQTLQHPQPVRPLAHAGQPA